MKRARAVDFWILWTDMVPCLVFWACAAEAQGFHTQLMCTGILLCRLCSLAYHTISMICPTMEPALFFLDLLGIASNSWAVPWILEASNSPLFKNKNVYATGVFCTYCLIACACVAGIFGSSFLLARRRLDFACKIQFLILVLSIFGSIPAIMSGRLLLVTGPCILGMGFIFFFRSGRGDYSHVLWHASTFVGQMCFVLESF